MRARVKPGQRDNFMQQMRDMDRRRRPEGLEAVELGWEDRDRDRMVMIVHFRDRESYMANAQTSEQDREYRAMLAYLDGEPEWIDVQFQDDD
jgi:quinol monooxygenase YgiN